MTEARVNPILLHWSRERARLGAEELAAKLAVQVERILAWEGGELRPTFRQAQNWANAVHVPFGYLFLNKRPTETAAIPDLRTVRDQNLAEMSVDLRDTVADVLRKQAWYRERKLADGAQPLAFVGSVSKNVDPSVLADRIVQALRLATKDREAAENWEGFFDLIARRAEDAGVLVMRNGVVGSNTSRRLSIDEFRGFAVVDDLAPAVFINGADAKAAQLFTLVHELAHLWLGESGISDPSLASVPGAASKAIEKTCNAAAAEVLAPARLVREQWLANRPLEQNASRLAKLLHVSAVVVARRAQELGLAPWEEYRQFYGDQAALWQARKDRGSGGNFYASVPVRNSRRLTAAVVQSALANDVLLRDAGRMLSIPPSKVERLAVEIGLG